MAEPAAAQQTQRGRMYTLETLPAEWLAAHRPAEHVRMSGTTAIVPSVTTILGHHSKPGLVWWSAGEVATYALTHPDATRTLIASAADIKPAGDHPCKACGQPTERLISGNDWWMHAACEKAWKQLRQTFNTQRERKANIGTLVHELIERHILGDPIIPDDYREYDLPDGGQPVDVSGHVRTWLRFVERHDPTFEASEMTVFNLEYGFAGTLDMIATVGGSRWLVDVKTGPNVYLDHSIQLAAYRHAEGVYLGAGEVAVMPEVDDTAVLLIGEGKYKFEPVQADRAAFDGGFVPLLMLERWKQTRKDA